MVQVGTRLILKAVQLSQQKPKLRQRPRLVPQGALVTRLREYEKKLYYRFISARPTLYHRVGAEHIDWPHGPELVAPASGMAS